MLPTKTQSLHHAYVIEGNPRDTKPVILDFVVERTGLVVGNPDLFIIETGMFGVDEAEQVVIINSRKAFGISIPNSEHGCPNNFAKKEKVLILIADSFSQTAQNALLKTLEEPSMGTYIFILTGTASLFLPTVLSRVQVIKLNIPDGNVSGRSNKLDTDQMVHKQLDAHEFIQNSLADRLLQVKEIIKLKEDEKITDREVFNFLQEVEKSAHQKAAQITKKGDQKAEIQVAEVITKVSDYIKDTSSSKKILLEYVALRLPIL